MAVIECTHTMNGLSGINYAISKRPHVSNKVVKKRVLEASGLNCTPDGAKKQFQATWNRFGIGKANSGRRQLFRVVQSFDPTQLSYKKPEDVQKANQIGLKFASKAFKGRQVLVITQADNSHHILHNHILVSEINFTTGKAFTRKETDKFKTLIPLSDEVIRGFGLNPTHHKLMHGKQPVGTVNQTNAQYHIQAKGSYSWVSDFQNRLRRASENALSWADFMNKAKKSGISVNPYRKHKGKIRIENGSPVFKAHVSYKGKDKNGKSHTIRDRRLGQAFGKDYLGRQFKENLRFDTKRRNYENEIKKKRQEAKSKRQEANSFSAENREQRSSYHDNVLSQFSAESKATSASKFADSVSASAVSFSASVSTSASKTSSAYSESSASLSSEINSYSLSASSLDSTCTSLSSEIAPLSSNVANYKSEASNLNHYLADKFTTYLKGHLKDIYNESKYGFKYLFHYVRDKYFSKSTNKSVNDTYEKQYQGSEASAFAEAQRNNEKGPIK